MPLTERENWLRAARRQRPEWIPYHIGLTKISWHKFGEEQEKVVLAHPRTWPAYRPGDFRKIVAAPWSKKEDPARDFVDEWGCVWRTTQHGFVGTIVEHPLASEEALRHFAPPPRETYNGGQTPVDFALTGKRLAEAKRQGRLAQGGLDHGFFLLRLEYLRGFENLMCDLIDPSADFVRLYETVHDWNRAAVENWIAAGADVIGLPEDLGSQKGSIVGPPHFRRWALPKYKELHSMAQRAGAVTRFHCDGAIMDIADQILEIAPTVFNPQDVANGIDNLASAFKGRICIDLDFDRQRALPFGSRKDIEDLVEQETRVLGSAEGGLMFHVEIRSDVPPDNLDAVAGALERFAAYWAER